MVPSAPGCLSGNCTSNRNSPLLVADRVALAAAIAKFAEIAVDRSEPRL